MMTPSFLPLVVLLLAQCLCLGHVTAVPTAHTGTGTEQVKECKSVGEVISLDRDNFYKMVMPRKDKWLLYFHAPWCAKCKELRPVLESVAQQGAGKFFVGSIDCGDDVWMRTMFGLRAYPTFKLAHKEVMYPYPQKGNLDDEYLFEFADETFVKYMKSAELFPEM